MICAFGSFIASPAAHNAANKADDFFYDTVRLGKLRKTIAAWCGD